MLKFILPLLISTKSYIIYTNICLLRAGNIKVIAKPIEVVAWYDTEGDINPIRFKITNEGVSNSVLKVDRVICVDKEKLAGNNICWYISVRV